MTRWDGLFVQAVYVVEDDPDRLHETFSRRSSASRFLALSPAEQRGVVAMNVDYGAWLRAEAEARGQPWVTSWPWATLPERLLDAVH